MKKISILGVCLLTGISAMGQASLVKDVERQLKGSNPDNAKAMEAIQPALTNPETSNTMMPWYLAGKAGFGIYDDAFLQQSLGNELKGEQKVAAGKGLLDGYNYYIKALHLDSLPDEKGKVKPKKSKEIISQLVGAYPHFRNAGVFLFDNQKYDEAYDAWEVYVNLPNNPLLGNKAPKADPDTIVGQIIFYQGVAALSNNQSQKALDKMRQVIPTGFNNIYVYTYGTEAARRLGDTASMLEFAQNGYEKYGTEDVSLIGQLINAKLEARDYPAAFDLVSQAIEKTDPSNVSMISQLYDIRGVIYEQDGKIEAAINDFNKAIDVNPNAAKAYYDRGRMKFNSALEKADQSNDTISDEIKNQFLSAIEDFKKAYELDDTMSQIPGNIYLAYYKLGAGYESDANLWKSLSGM